MLLTKIWIFWVVEIEKVNDRGWVHFLQGTLMGNVVKYIDHGNKDTAHEVKSVENVWVCVFSGSVNLAE